MRLKDGVKVHGIRPELLLALQIADAVYRERGHSLTVTSLTDGTHSATSLHYAGAAADLRIWGVDEPHAMALEIGAALGEDYDVLAERTHIHLEYQPRHSGSQ